MSPKDKKNELEQKNPDSVFINREVSWLEFNLRVLLEAADPAVPLLERLKFLMIYQSNMEEFFRVRLRRMPETSFPAWIRSRRSMNASGSSGSSRR